MILKYKKCVLKKNFKVGDKSSKIIYNDKVIIHNIPAYDYIVNDKSAISWIMDEYKIDIDEEGSIINDPNLYSDDSYYKVIEVSICSVDLIAKLPAMDIIER